jgi:hypothetical protein
MTEEIKNEADNKLAPEKQKVLGEIIESVLSEYDKESKFYTADTLHYLRSKITKLAKEKLGSDIHSVDVILDLRHVQDIRFGFKVNIPVPAVPEIQSTQV